jgi:hypothetical protein
MKTLNVTIGFSSDDKNYNWRETLEKTNGFRLISEKVIENISNPNFPKWNFIVNYNCEEK